TAREPARAPLLGAAVPDVDDREDEEEGNDLREARCRFRDSSVVVSGRLAHRGVHPAALGKDVRDTRVQGTRPERLPGRGGRAEAERGLSALEVPLAFIGWFFTVASACALVAGAALIF